MRHLIAVAGAALVLAGAVCLFWSIDLSGIERGTAYAISGAVFLTGGVITLALARLGALLERRSAETIPAAAGARSSSPAPSRLQAETSALAASMAAAALAQTGDGATNPTESARVAERGPAHPKKHGSDQDRERDPEHEGGQEHEDDQGHEGGQEQERLEEQGRVQHAELVHRAGLGPSAERGSAFMSADASAPRHDGGGSEDEAREAVSTRQVDDDLQASRLTARLPSSLRFQHEPIPAPAPRWPAPPRLFPSSEPRIEDEAPEAALDSLEQEPPAPLPHAGAAPPTAPAAEHRLVGRYQANGVDYSLFSDGSIETDQNGEKRRFSSLAELKNFIDGR